jgi:hypothetical protein
VHGVSVVAGFPAQTVTTRGMRRVPTLAQVSNAVALTALATTPWASVPAGTAFADEGGVGIASAVAEVATKLAAAGVGAPSSQDGASGAAAVVRASAHLPAAAPEPRAQRLRRLVVVRSPVGLSGRPGGPARLRVGSTTEFGLPRVLAIAARRRGWLGVIATERPNNRLAWVRRGSPQLRLRRTRWSLHADLSARTLTLRKAGRRARRMTVAIGRPGAETPTGRFAVTDKLNGSSFGPYYGCCILALSGHQPKTPPGWTGGNRLAIHGTNAPSTIGTAASAGFFRASDADLVILMRKVPLGTQVFIRR